MKRFILVLMVLFASSLMAQVGPSFDDIATGTGKFADGTAAAPSITFGSDPDTGIYRYEANVLGVSTGGAISSLLTDGVYYVIKNSSEANATSRLRLNALRLDSVTTTYAAVGSTIATSTVGAVSGHLTFETTNGSSLAERARITNLGNLLIGTTTDDGVNKLQIGGDGVRIKDSSNNFHKLDRVLGISNIPSGASATIEIRLPSASLISYFSCDVNFLGRSGATTTTARHNRSILSGALISNVLHEGTVDLIAGSATKPTISMTAAGADNKFYVHINNATGVELRICTLNIVLFCHSGSASGYPTIN
jgi:hypothetical protein